MVPRGLVDTFGLLQLQFITQILILSQLWTVNAPIQAITGTIPYQPLLVIIAFVNLDPVTLAFTTVDFFQMIHYGMAKDVPLLARAVNSTDLHGFVLLYLKQTTTEDLEIRLCKDQSSFNEDIVVSYIDILTSNIWTNTYQ